MTYLSAPLGFVALRALANGGSADAQFRLGNVLIAQQDETGRRLPQVLQEADEETRRQQLARSINEAMLWYARAADLGHAEAASTLAFEYSFSDRPDGKTKAIKYYCRAAELGLVAAYGPLASLYEDGSGEPEDRQLAIDRLRKASAMGHAQVTYRIGQIYNNGNAGVAPDKSEARKWFLLAAEQGEPAAYYDLALLHCSDVDSKNSSLEGRLEAEKLIRQGAALGSSKCEDVVFSWEEQVRPRPVPAKRNSELPIWGQLLMFVPALYLWSIISAALLGIVFAVMSYTVPICIAGLVIHSIYKFVIAYRGK